MPSLNKEQKEYLKSKIEESYNFLDKFNDFNIQNRFNLTTSQFNYIIVLSTINISFIIFLSQFKDGISNIFSLTSLISSILLVLFAMIYIRSKIDDQHKDLDKTELYLRDIHEKHVNKILEVFESQKIEDYFEYARSQTENKNIYPKKISYVGEFFTIIFILSFLCTLVSFFYPEVNSIMHMLIVFAISFLLGFFDIGILLERFLTVKK